VRVETGQCLDAHKMHIICFVDVYLAGDIRYAVVISTIVFGNLFYLIGYKLSGMLCGVIHGTDVQVMYLSPSISPRLDCCDVSYVFHVFPCTILMYVYLQLSTGF